jgi:predicted nucleic acid-binding protein
LIVVDTNVIAYLIVPGERTDQARAALRKDPEWAAPLLWRSELRNVLALYMRQGQLSIGDALRLCEEAERLLQGAEYQVASAPVLSLSQVSRCSAYDCEFVALAQDLGVPLVTTDRQVLAGFPGIAVSLDDFCSG